MRIKFNRRLTQYYLNIPYICSVTKTENIMKWICTDPATNQWGRKLADKLYEFKEDIYYPDGLVVKAEAEIDLNEYTEEEIEEHLAPYGWSIDQLKEENSLQDVEWLMAECIFEQTAY